MSRNSTIPTLQHRHTPIHLQEREEVEEYLLSTLKFGWEEVFQPGEQANQPDDGVTVYRHVVNEEGGEKVEAEATDGDLMEGLQDERPVYVWEEDQATRIIQRLMRAFEAKCYVKMLRRQQQRDEKAAKDREKWEIKKQEQERHVTVRLKLLTMTADEELEGATEETAGDGAAVKDIEDEMARLVDGDEVAPLVVGFPVEARYGAGEHHFPGTVYQVNPTQYSTSEGIKWYPKGTYGVMYDDGDFEPAVSRSCIRVIKLKPGARIEAQYGGHPAFFPGKVSALNERDGRVLSYSIEYDDGTFEKAVTRSRIRWVGLFHHPAPRSQPLDNHHLLHLSLPHHH